MEAIERSVIKNSVEYEFALLKKIVNELNERKNLFYYAYEPAGEKQKDFHLTVEKIRILDGVNRTGKSTTAFHDMYMFMAGEHPRQKEMNMPVPNLWWIVVSNFKKVWEPGGLWDEKVLKQCPMNLVEPSKIVRDTKRNNYSVVFKNGSGFGFISLEQGIGAFRSAAINGFLVDERVKDEAIRGQLRMRIFDKGGIGIFNMDLLQPDDWMDELLLKGMAQKWTLTMDDNKFLDPAEIERIQKELGDAEKFILLSGNRVSPDESYLFTSCWNDECYQEIAPTRYEIDYKNSELTMDAGGLLRVFCERRPDITYYIVVDAAEGVGHDETVINIIDENCEQIACWHDKNTRLREQKYIVYFLSRYYNDGLIVTENNGAAGVALTEGLRDLGANIYVSWQIGEDGKVKNMHDGIKTEKDNKPVWVNNTEEDLRKGWIKLHYWVTKDQLSNFGIASSGKYKGLKKLRWRDNLGYGDKEKNGDLIGEDDHAMSIIIADHILRAQGHIGKRHVAKVMTLEERKRQQAKEYREKYKDSVFVNGVPVGEKSRNFVNF